MTPEEVTVRGLLAGILLFIIAVTANVLSSAGVQLHIVVLWCIIVLLLGMSAAGPLRMLPKQFSKICFIIGILLILLTIIIQLRVIPICGDGICSGSECNSCTKDCSPQQCLDGICQKVESCATSKDCACFTLACAPGRNGSDAKGCAPIVCGDGFCDAGEGPSTCCSDCGCNTGYICDKNICYFEIPKVTYTPYQLTKTISVISLAGNPLLTDIGGNNRSFMILDLRTSKSIENVSVNFTIPGLLENTVRIPLIYTEQEVAVPWYVHPDSRLLSVTNDTNTSIIVYISYNDALGNPYLMNKSFPLLLLSRNTLDGFGHIVLFAQEVQTTSKTPRGIWNELQAKVTLQPRSDAHVQFPEETLAAGAGSQTDIAVLLASAYNTAGLRTYIVASQSGYFVRVWNNDRFVILDPSRISGSFDDAISFVPGYGVYGINQTRAARNFTEVRIE